MDPAEPRTFIAETGLPVQRRRKVRLACNPCRARKTGCDGTKPVCTACSLRGWNDKCFWQDSVLPSPNALTLVDLDRRLQRLETSARPGPDAGPARRLSPSVLGQDIAHAQPASLEDTDDGEASDDPVDSTRATDHSMFMRDAMSAVISEDQNANPTQSLLPERVVPNLIGFSVETFDPSFGVFDRRTIILPTQSIADDLVRWYWRHVHTIFPILHRPTFEAQYQTLWSSDTHFAPSGGANNGEELVFHAILNMVMALGCRRHEAMSQSGRDFHADQYYERSQRLISVDTLDASSLSLVQLLLLRTLFFYFTTRADRCWIMFGAAVRMAVGIGLHTPGPRKGNVSQLDREMRRRVWHCGCYTIDQILSTSFGRPAMIYKEMNKAPLPLVIDDEYLSTTEEGFQPDDVPALVAHAIYGLKATEILEEIRVVIFAARLKASQPRPGESVGPDPSTLLRINSRIDDYLGEAPPHLQPFANFEEMGVDADHEACFRIQSNVLRSRMTVLRILLLRSSVLADVQKGASSSLPPAKSSTAKLEERLHREVRELCLSAVHASLDEMHQALFKVDEFPAWHCLHVAFASATVLIAAALSPNLGVNFDTEPTRSSWDKAIQIMHRHQPQIASAAKGIEVLQHLRQYISAKVSSQHSSPNDRSASMSPTTTRAPSSIPPEYLYISTQNSYNAGSGVWTDATAPPIAPHDGFNIPPKPHFPIEQPYYPEGYYVGNVPVGATEISEPKPDLMEGLEDYLSSNSLDHAWLASQDIGNMLNWGQPGG